MRLRILARPTDTLAGVSPDHFDVGGVYEIRSHVACVYLAKGWAEAVTRAVPAAPEGLVQIKAVVLVFEDEAALRRLTGKLLAYRGYRVEETRHGEEAIERLRQQCRSVMVLDLTAPSAAGCKLRVDELYLTHTRVSAMPVLLRADEDEAIDYATKLDAIAVVKAPFDPDAVLQALA